MAEGWRYLAQRILPGEPADTWPWIDNDLPLTGAKVTDVLSGPTQLTGTIDPVYRRLKAGDGRPVLDEWGTVIYAEADGTIRAGAIYTGGIFDGPQWRLDCAGFTAYPKGMGYEGERKPPFVDADPLDIVRHIWDHIQAGLDSNLGLNVDVSTTTPVRIGTAEGFVTTDSTTVPEATQAAVIILARLQSGQPVHEDWTWPGAPTTVTSHVDELATAYGGDVHDLAATIDWLQDYIADHGEFTTVTASGVGGEPFELNEWSTDDLGRVIDDLARSTPFDYHERHFWNATRTAVRHELVFGYPRLGQRRPDLRFVFGENIHTTPGVTRDGARYANHVRFLGAGEGQDMIRAESRRRDGRLRRMVTVDDKSVASGILAHRRARRELIGRQLLPTVADVVVRDTATTPLGSWGVGDEIRVQGELDWIEVDQWCRVVSLTVSPDTPEVIGMTLLRTDLA